MPVVRASAARFKGAVTGTPAAAGPRGNVVLSGARGHGAGGKGVENETGWAIGAGASAVLARAPATVMLADAGASAVLADAPAAVMLADTGDPAVFAGAPLRCAHPLPVPPPFPPASSLSLPHRIVGLLPRRVVVSPFLAALAALALLLPVPPHLPRPHRPHLSA